MCTAWYACFYNTGLHYGARACPDTRSTSKGHIVWLHALEALKHEIDRSPLREIALIRGERFSKASSSKLEALLVYMKVEISRHEKEREIDLV